MKHCILFIFLFLFSKRIQSTKYDKFKNPVVSHEFVSKLCEQCYLGQEIYVFPDNNPQMLSTDNLKKIDHILFPFLRNQDQKSGYSFTVNVNQLGNVFDYTLNSASSGVNYD